MKSVARIATSLVAVLALWSATPAHAQICGPLVPSGQPALMPFTPPCIGAIPPPAVWLGGNPGFALAAFAPLPVPPGMFTFLLIGTPTPPVPLGGLTPAFGLPAMLTTMPFLLAFAGPSGPLPGPPVPLPLPATGGPLGPAVLSVHTIVISPPGLPPLFALTGATAIGV
jgi:hypothetical protein